MMSSGSGSSRNRHRARRRRLHHGGVVPTEILSTAPAPPVLPPTSSESPIPLLSQPRDEHDTPEYDSSCRQRQRELWQRPRRGVEIRPGHEWLSCTTTAANTNTASSSQDRTVPPEPREPPPVPDCMVPVVLLGHRQVGKSSLVQMFCDRQSSAGKSNRTDAAAVAASSPSSSSSSSSCPPWSVEYRKKDVTFFGAEGNVTCARVQLWTVSGAGPSFTTSHTKTTGATMELQNLLKRAAVCILVTSLENGAETLLQEAASWKRWLDEETSGTTNSRRVWLIHKSDLLPSSNDVLPAVWMRLGSDVANSCRDLGMDAWYLTSIVAGHREDSVHHAMMQIVKETVMRNAHGNSIQLARACHLKPMKKPNAKDDHEKRGGGKSQAMIEAVPLSSASSSSASSSSWSRGWMPL